MRKLNALIAAVVLAAAVSPTPASAKSWADYQCESLRKVRPLIRNPVTVSCLWPGATGIEFLCRPLTHAADGLPVIEAEVYSERCASPNSIFAG